MDKQKSQ